MEGSEDRNKAHEQRKETRLDVHRQHPMTFPVSATESTKSIREDLKGSLLLPFDKQACSFMFLKKFEIYKIREISP